MFLFQVLLLLGLPLTALGGSTSLHDLFFAVVLANSLPRTITRIPPSQRGWRRLVSPDIVRREQASSTELLTKISKLLFDVE